MTRTVAELCREQTIDVAELSDRSGLDESRVTAIALGRWTPSPVERQKIASVFGVAADQIAWNQNNAAEPQQSSWLTALSSLESQESHRKRRCISSVFPADLQPTIAQPIVLPSHQR